MRTPVGVALVTVCLGLAGCSLFGKKQAAHNNNPKPFLGAETPAAKETTAATPAVPGAPLPGANGYLAGQVIQTSTGRPVKSFIEVKDIEDDTVKAAAVEIESNENGYFTISGLKPGRHYRLIARAKEGEELASGTVFATPPKPTLLIQLSRQATTPNTPPVPDRPKTPGKPSTTGTESGQERSPPASLDPPVKIPPGREPAPSSEGDAAPPAGGGAGTSQGGGTPPNIANVAEGFHHTPPPPVVSVPPARPSGAWPPPPPPQWEGMPDDRPAPPSPPPSPPPLVPAAPPPPSVHLPNLPTRVPSCLLVGNKLENFALKDLNGETWEYRRQHQGRLVLLDFWYSTCSACKHAMPRLNDLQNKYRAYKLEVIGIDCDTGPVEEQIRNVLSVRGRYSMNYLTLLSGGGPEHCPVVAQFRVERYPTLFLLDESGKIIWRSPDDGMDLYAWQTLEKLIANRLLSRP